MKRRYLLIIGFLFFVYSLVAAIGPFRPLGNMRFAGKQAVYASGDTLAMVYLDIADSLTFLLETSTAPSPIISHPLPTVSGAGAPNLLYSATDCYIATNKGVGKSFNGGIDWQIEPYRSYRCLENSPFLEVINDALILIENHIPYPEDLMENFLIPGTDEFPVPGLSVGKTSSVYNESICFTGMDEFLYNSPVYINDDLWIRQTSGNNQGWPRFDGPVFCSGQVRVFPDGGHTFPETTIFRGGLYENQPPAPLPDTHGIRIGATVVGPPSFSEDRIIMVEVNGDQYTAWLGIIQPPQTTQNNIWPDYPQGTDQPPIGINNYPVRDTLWAPLGSGSCHNRSMFVNSKLWIKGNFAGKQSWGASDSLFIIGDITLEGVTPGQQPGPGDPSVCLFSEESIILKYGYNHPVSNTRIHPLCRSDNNPIYIYANLFATGRDHDLPPSRGEVTFEYQHPHPSIPAQIINVPSIGDTLYEYIDLHRYFYPQTTSHPWQSWMDYPWYNPLYPEAHPYLMRGTVKHYGLLSQMRMGRFRTSYIPSNNSNPDGIWNISQGMYGGSTAPNPHTITLWQDPLQEITLQNMNYPGCNQSASVGYIWNNYQRPNLPLNYIIPDIAGNMNPDHPYEMENYWNLGIHALNLDSEDPYNLPFSYPLIIPQLRLTRTKNYDNNGQASAYSINNRLAIREDQEYEEDLSFYVNQEMMINALALGADNSVWFAQQALDLSYHIVNLSPDPNEILHEYTIPASGTLCDLFRMPDGRVFFAHQLQDHQIGVHWLNSPAGEVLYDTWNIAADAGYPDLNITTGSKLYVLPATANATRIMIYNPHEGSQGRGILHLATADLSVSNSDEYLPVPVPASLYCYPNPMQGNLKIRLSAPENTVMKLDVYNLKGQRIRSFTERELINNAETTWDGLDQDGRKTSSGIYIITLSAHGKALQSKRICKIN